MEALREVVRLSLGEGQPTLNVLSAGVDGDHLSVVCPFPVLPLDVPVSITMPGGGRAPVSAIIRKVKIELAEETDLPRFKLHLDLLHEKAEACEGLSIELDEFGAEPEADPDAGPAEPPRVEPPAVGSSMAEPPTADLGLEALTTAALQTAADLDEGEPDDVAATEIEEPDVDCASDLPDASDGPTEHGEDPFFAEGDPPWAATAFENALPRAEEPSERRSRWPVRIAVAFGLVVSAAAVGYVTRDQLAAFARPFVGDRIQIAGIELDLTGSQSLGQAESAMGALAQDRVASHVHPPSASAPADPTPTAGPEPAVEAGSPLSDDALAASPSPQPVEGADSEDAPAVQDSGDRIRVTLPTQWPVSEARSYRLHDPTGIVVDVPGGLASPAARWIDTAHDRVRSVRVLEREDGVRFIIYLNDEQVPRYRVGYGQNGVTVDILGPDPRHVAS